MKSMNGHTVYQMLSEDKAFWGRLEGRSVRAEIESMLDTIDAGETLIVDLKLVEVMDFSFSSEVFGKIIGGLAVRFPSRMLVLANLSEFVKENLSAALADLGLLALAYKGPRSWELIGRWTETDHETLSALHRLKAATAPQLAQALTIQLTTCNQRLRKLSAVGLTTRIRQSATTGGELYVYRWPV